ncbi:hypothetical protein D3C78_1874250 [compost metagenome]
MLQLHHGFLFGNTNCDDLHPEIATHIDASKIPTKSFNINLNVIAKASFGFGDVNACVIFKKFEI